MTKFGAMKFINNKRHKQNIVSFGCDAVDAKLAYYLFRGSDSRAGRLQSQGRWCNRRLRTVRTTRVKCLLLRVRFCCYDTPCKQYIYIYLVNVVVFGNFSLCCVCSVAMAVSVFLYEVCYG